MTINNRIQNQKDADPFAIDKQSQLQFDHTERQRLALQAEAFILDLPDHVGDYQIIEPLGHGAYGVVMLAQHLKTNSPFALKIPYPYLFFQGDEDGFMREAKALAKLNHPGIVKFYEAKWMGEIWAICTERIKGKSLKEHQQQEPISTEQAINITIELLEALSHAHTAEVVHRDIKPSNIMFDSTTGRMKLLDFGMAKSYDSPSKSQTGLVKGSLSYMSPEQASGDVHRTDARSELFSVGVVLYEMLAHRRPFTGDSDLAIRSAITKSQHPSLIDIDPSLPLELVRVCDKALEKNQTKRFQTARDFADSLRDARSSLGATAVDTNGPVTNWSTAIYQFVLLMVAILLGIWATLLFTGKPPAEDRLRPNPIVATASNSDKKISAPIESRNVRICSIPQGNLTFFPLDGQRKPLVDQAALVSDGQVKLKPGEYLVVVNMPNGDFVEAIRFVPGEKDVAASSLIKNHHWELVDGSIELPSVEVVSFNKDEMIDCGEFWIDRKPIEGDSTTNHYVATQTCESKGKRLPTFAEMEIASRHIHIDSSQRYWTSEITDHFEKHLRIFDAPEVIRIWPNHEKAHKAATRQQDGISFYPVRSKKPLSSRANMKKLSSTQQ